MSTTKAEKSSTLSPSLIVVSPAVRVSSSEWFLYAPSSGARKSGPAARRLCFWLYNNLRTLLRSVTHAATILKFHNIPTQLDECCPDLAVFIPEVRQRKVSVPVHSDLDDANTQEYLAYRRRVLNDGGDKPGRPEGHAQLGSSSLLEATFNFTVATCPRSARSTLHSLCTATDEELDYLEYKEKILKLDGTAAGLSSERDPMGLLSPTTAPVPEAHCPPPRSGLHQARTPSPRQQQQQTPSLQPRVVQHAAPAP